MNLKRIIQRFILKDITTKDMPGSYSSYNDILNAGFKADKFEDIVSNLPWLIINNDFIVNPALIISYYQKHFNFTIEEFLIVIFKLGMISKLYINNPAVLVNDALSNRSLFSKEQIKELTKMQEDFNPEVLPLEVEDEFYVLLNRLRKGEELSNDEINKLIDEGLNKKRK